MTKNAQIPPKLRWACRRGMLELDVLLGNFLEEMYCHLSERDQDTFRALLALNDQDLFNYLTGRDIPENQTLIKMIEKIRTHAHTRHLS